MCRLLAVKSECEFKISKHLKIFSQLCKTSQEYQGHGWGLAYLNCKNEWVHYKNIKPIWEDNLAQFPKTKLLIAHARSAFEDKGIVVENNMPFQDDKYVFIFNGELRGVRIKEQGRIGAEKIFNFIKRFDKGDMELALRKASELIKKRTKTIKALNIIITDKYKLYVKNYFTERPWYFKLHYKLAEELVICSDPYPKEQWNEIEEDMVFQ